jgi:tRNA1(Val) A37 N6-methylase TrmN6
VNATNAIPDWSDDRFLGGNLTLRQRLRGHRAGTDAVLLAGLIPPDASGRAVDAGAASGAAGLMLALRAPRLSVDLIEIDPGDSALAAHNIAANGLADRCRIITADLLASEEQRESAGLVKGQADFVLSNPPYLNADAARISPDLARARAHAMPDDGLARWCRALAWLAAPGAIVALIHRTDALPDLLQALEGRFGDIAIRPVLPRADAPASRILLTARKASRAPLSILPAVVLHNEDGSFTQAAAALHAGIYSFDTRKD